MPVGSKNIAGRQGIDFAASTVRYELARLEELGFLDHPHTSAGRVPTDRGYRYYVDTLLTRDPPAQPPAVVETALDLTEMRREVDAALTRLADVVAQVTNLLSIVTAPPPESSTAAPRRGAPLQPQLVMVVAITSTGAVTKRVFAFERRGRLGPVRVGRRLPQRARRRARGGREDDREPPRRPVALGEASAASWRCSPRRSPSSRPAAPAASSWAGARASWPSSATWT